MALNRQAAPPASRRPGTLAVLLIALAQLPLAQPARAAGPHDDVVDGNAERVFEITSWCAPRFADYGTDSAVPGCPDTGVVWKFKGQSYGMALTTCDAFRYRLATRWSADTVVKYWVARRQSESASLLPDIARLHRAPSNDFVDSSFSAMCQWLAERGPVPVVLLDGKTHTCLAVVAYAVTRGRMFRDYYIRFYDPERPCTDEAYGSAVWSAEDGRLTDWIYGGPKIVLDPSHTKVVSIDSNDGTTYDRFFPVLSYSPTLPGNAGLWSKRPAE